MAVIKPNSGSADFIFETIIDMDDLTHRIKLSSFKQFKFVSATGQLY